LYGTRNGCHYGAIGHAHGRWIVVETS
jgi:hypothetical protein